MRAEAGASPAARGLGLALRLPPAAAGRRAHARQQPRLCLPPSAGLCPARGALCSVPARWLQPKLLLEPEQFLVTRHARPGLWQTQQAGGAAGAGQGRRRYHSCKRLICPRHDNYRAMLAKVSSKSFACY